VKLGDKYNTTVSIVYPLSFSSYTRPTATFADRHKHEHENT